jgi:hypothetical protein
MSSDRSIDRSNDSNDDDDNIDGNTVIVAKKSKSSAKRAGSSARSDDRSSGNTKTIRSAQRPRPITGTKSSTSRSTSTINSAKSNNLATADEDEDEEDTIGSKQSQSTKSSAVSSSQKEVQHRSTPRLGKINEVSALSNDVFGNSSHENEDTVGNPFGTFQMLDDTAFGSTSFPITTGLDTSFDAAFASDVVNFDGAFSTNDANITNTATGISNFNDAFDMDTIPDFPGFSTHREEVEQEPQVIYDSTPLTNVPKMEQPTLVLPHKVVMQQNFYTAPIQNPANGNILFISSPSSSSSIPCYHGNDTIMIHEVDPNRNYIPVTSWPVVSLELRRLVANKYNATIKSIHKIWSLTMGLIKDHHRSPNNRRPLGEQLVAIIDFRIVQAATTMRLVVMWQRTTASSSSSTFDLCHVTTPPSGGDFVCDLSTIQVSDGLLFIGGASPKGSCVFVSKPTYREAWTANFVTGSGSVLAMSVSLTKPYLVVALADKSITVWTYQSAIQKRVSDDENDSHKAVSKRWLFPLCRLQYDDALSVVSAMYPGLDQVDDKGDDKNGTLFQVFSPKKVIIVSLCKNK